MSEPMSSRVPRGPKPGMRPSHGASAWRSDCPLRRRGVFAGDETVWITRPVAGRVHKHCAPKES